ncbi:MAG TPA: amidohydrolase family protein [Chloroflexota bacterium]
MSVADAPIVDAHHHFWWEPSQESYPWMTDSLTIIRRTFGPEELHPLLAECGVDCTVLVQTRSNLAETRDFLELAARTDFIAGVVGWADLTDPRVDITLRELQAGMGGSYLKGIRHQVHDEQDPRWLLRDDVLQGLRAVGELGLAYDFLVRPREVPAAHEVACMFPEMRFVIDHLAKPPISRGGMNGWETGMAAISELQNVSCKLSGMVTEADWSTWKRADLAPYIDRVVGWFGSDRLMFGSDWPVCLLAASYDQVFAAYSSALVKLPYDARLKILGGNAIAFYKLDCAKTDRAARP